MKIKLITLALALTFLISGCSINKPPELSDEPIETLEVIEFSSPEEESSDNTLDVIDSNVSLDEKFLKIDFHCVSGMYTRKVLQDDIELVEMFSFEKNSFIRIASNEMEQEVYAYNYLSDDFTYLYYFDGELMSKTKINLETNAILEDTAEYAELLFADAEELKIYFGDLLEASGLNVEEL